MGGLKRTIVRSIKRKTKVIQDKQYELIKHEFVKQLAVSAMYTGLWGPLPPDFIKEVADRLEEELKLTQVTNHRDYFDAVVRVSQRVDAEHAAKETEVPNE